MAVLENLEPKDVFTFFEEISNIPRGSGNEQQISNYIVSFAIERGLEYYQDNARNILVKKPGTHGYEASPAVILQSHIDMVCEKNSATIHDFLIDPLKLHIVEDFITAEGTTLGADNGIAAAYALALLDSENIPHPPLEAVFTTDEEVGMNGASAFDGSLLEGRRMLNMDTEEEGYFVVSCCGGIRATLHLAVERIESDINKIPIAIQIRGLKGGHSGTEIHLQRPNANKLMGRILLEIKNVCNYDLAAINGGLMDNAIARECEAVVLINPQEFSILEDCVKSLEKTFIHEYRGCDTGILLKTIQLKESVPKSMNKKTRDNIISALILIPYGVRTVSMEIEGAKLVESSSNIGIVKTNEEFVDFTSAIRSSVSSRKTIILQEIKLIAELIGAEVSLRGDYPAWEFKSDSPLLTIFQNTYQTLYSKKAEVQSIHAGLECGVFAGKIEGMDIISFGPDMFDVHTPDERLSISSTARVWEFLKEVLKQLK